MTARKAAVCLLVLFMLLAGAGWLNRKLETRYEHGPGEAHNKPIQSLNGLETSETGVLRPFFLPREYIRILYKLPEDPEPNSRNPIP